MIEYRCGRNVAAVGEYFMASFMADEFRGVSLMRVSVAGLLCVMMIAGAVSVAGAQSEIWVDRVEEDGRLLVPIRGIFEAFGATVDWDGAVREVMISHRGSSIVMWVNDRSAYVDGMRYQLDVPPRLVNGRVHVPLRFVGEALGGSVDYIIDYVDITVDGHLLRVHLRPQSFSGGSGYIAGWTNRRLVTDADLQGYSNWMLTLMRNEIYARHGRFFDNAHVRSYFMNQSWYTPDPSFQESWLNSTESTNAQRIRNYQVRRFGRTATRP